MSGNWVEGCSLLKRAESWSQLLKQSEAASDGLASAWYKDFL